MTIDEIVSEIELTSNSGHPKYSHPNNAARLYQVFQDVGMAIGQRMAVMQKEDREG